MLCCSCSVIPSPQQVVGKLALLWLVVLTSRIRLPLWMCNSIRIYHFEEGGGGAGLFEPVGNCSLRSIRGDSIFRTPPCSFVFVGLLFIVKNFI